MLEYRDTDIDTESKNPLDTDFDIAPKKLSDTDIDTESKKCIFWFR